MTNFPTSLDILTNPQATDAEDKPGVEHDLQHANANDAIEALQAKLGITGSTDPNSIDAKIKLLVSGSGAPASTPIIPMQFYFDTAANPTLGQPILYLWVSAAWQILI